MTGYSWEVYLYISKSVKKKKQRVDSVYHVGSFKPVTSFFSFAVNVVSDLISPLISKFVLVM